VYQLKRGKGSLVVLPQIVLCSGIIALSDNRTLVTQSNDRNISDYPKQKRTLKLAITALILMPTFRVYYYCFGILCPETCHTYQILRSQVKSFTLQEPHKLSCVRTIGSELAVDSTRLFFVFSVCSISHTISIVENKYTGSFASSSRDKDTVG
jgi:hypothetical protein